MGDASSVEAHDVEYCYGKTKGKGSLSGTREKVQNFLCDLTFIYVQIGNLREGRMDVCLKGYLRLIVETLSAPIADDEKVEDVRRCCMWMWLLDASGLVNRRGVKSNKNH